MSGSDEEQQVDIGDQIASGEDADTEHEADLSSDEKHNYYKKKQVALAPTTREATCFFCNNYFFHLNIVSETY